MMIAVLGLGEIGDGEQVGGLEIGDDEALALGENFLGLGDNVAVLRHDRLDQLEGSDRRSFRPGSPP